MDGFSEVKVGTDLSVTILPKHHYAIQTYRQDHPGLTPEEAVAKIIEDHHRLTVSVDRAVAELEAIPA
jgi:hypothetical protein